MENFNYGLGTFTLKFHNGVVAMVFSDGKTETANVMAWRDGEPDEKITRLLYNTGLDTDVLEGQDPAGVADFLKRCADWE